MNPDEIREQLLKLFPNVLKFVGIGKYGYWAYRDITDHGGGFIACLYNDPLNDLNVMHQIERSIIRIENDSNNGFWHKYLRKLNEVCVEYNFNEIHARAIHKAEAVILAAREVH